MELELFRHDILQTGTTAPGTMAVLPMSEDRKSQRVALGDLSGVLQVFSIKKGELLLAFKTLPSIQKVTSVTIGKGPSQRDKIFLACGDQIKGITYKGKEFFKFNTQLTETIRKVDVSDKNIWSEGEYIHNHFIEGKDKAFFLSPDRINDAEVVTLANQQDFHPVLACQDRRIRILSGSNILYEVSTTSAPTALRYIPEMHDPTHRFPTGKELLYGTEGGTLHQLIVEEDANRAGFTLPNPKKLGAIKAVYSGIDLTKTGMNDIVVGREDGLVEIYDVNEMGALQQVYSMRLNESVNSVEGGYITSISAPEVIAHTFSGKVLTFAPAGGGMLLPIHDALRTEKKTAATDVAAEDRQRKEMYQHQIMRLQLELESLKSMLEVERQRYNEMNMMTEGLVEAQTFQVQDKCRLEPDEACYVLTIEAAVPIFTVAIQSTLKLQLLDVPSNVAIMSRSPPDEKNGSMTLATYRCQDSTARLVVKFKVREGQSGTIQAYVIPAISPKTCQCITHKVRSLCLHQRIPEFDETRITNELSITGTFSVAEMHLWLQACLPDLPPNLPAGQEQMVFVCQNTLLGSQLSCRYRTGESRFVSDLITTLGILHEHVMREATAAKHRVSVSFNPSTQSLKVSLTRVWPQLEAQRGLKKKFELLEGLQELKMQDGDVSYLQAEYKAILDNGDDIRRQYQEQPQHLDHLTALVADLYTDFCRLTGISTPKTKLPQLQTLLLNTNSTLDDVMDFMLSK